MKNRIRRLDALAVLLLILALPATAAAQVQDWSGRGGTLADRLGAVLQQAGGDEDTRVYAAFRLEALVPSDARSGGSGVMVIGRSGGWVMSGLSGLIRVSDAWDDDRSQQVLDLGVMKMVPPDPDPTLQRRPVLAVLTARPTAGGMRWVDAGIRLPEGKMDLRGRTFYWLGEVTNSEAISWLRTSLSEEDLHGGFREDLVGLASLQPRGMGAPALLEELLDDPEEDIRHRAIAYLGRRPEDTTVVLERVFQGSEHQEDRAEALEALADRLGPGAQERLVDAVRDLTAPEVVRRTALGYLSRIPGRQVDRVMEGLLQEDDADMRQRVVAAWERRAPDRAVPLLERIAAEDPDEDVREQAVSSLGDIEGALSTAALRRIFDDHPQEDLRVEALEELVRRPEAVTVPWLEDLALGDGSVEVRKEAVQALGRMEDPAARQALRRILSGRHE